MPARMSSGSGGQKTPKVKKVKQTPSPPASVPAKTVSGARRANKTYGPGPVTVYTTPPAVPKTTRRAIRTTNKAVGATVLKPVRTRVKADVVVRAGTVKRFAEQGFASAGGLGSAAGANGKGRVQIARGFLRARGAVQARAKQHEIGHALGLDHPGSAKDPYVGKGPKKRVARSGVMGSGPVLNRSEVRRIRRLRGLANEKAGIPAIVPPKKAAKAARPSPDKFRPVRGGKAAPHGHAKSGPADVHQPIRKVAPHGHGKPTALSMAKAGNYGRAVAISRRALGSEHTKPRLAKRAYKVLTDGEVGGTVYRKAIKSSKKKKR